MYLFHRPLKDTISRPMATGRDDATISQGRLYTRTYLITCHLFSFFIRPNLKLNRVQTKPEVSVAGRVTRLVKFPPIGTSFTLGSFLEVTHGAQFLVLFWYIQGESCVLI
jgi:hypothetical protein